MLHFPIGAMADLQVLQASIRTIANFNQPKLVGFACFAVTTSQMANGYNYKYSFLIGMVQVNTKTYKPKYIVSPS